MTDIVDRQTRSRMMSGIRGKNTKPEIVIRKGLFALGFRYRLHPKGLPGKPDIVLPRYHAAIQINGCFWHGHNCPLFKWPSTNPEFWKQKIGRNRERDIETNSRLEKLGWRVLTIWECSFRGPSSSTIAEVVDITAEWIDSDSPSSAIPVSQ